MYKKLLFAVLFMPVSVFAQNTYDMVYTTLHTKCSNAACHSASSAEALKFDGSSAAVYAALVNQRPTNTASLARNEKLVWVNQPYDSYLLKKAASWLDTDLDIPAAEADSVHVNAGLSNIEAEFIRQWIMYGAGQTGNYIDTNVIHAYYNDTARAAFYPKPAKPAPGTGVQVHMGPIFVPGTGTTEVEYCLKHEVDFAGNVEVTATEGNMNPQSHHFLLFRFDDSASAAAMPDGMRRILLTSGNSSFDGNKSLSSAWQTSQTYSLPTQTAFFWPQKTFLDLNYHMKNYTAPGNSGVQPFDFYLNVATTPHLPTSNTIEMKTRLVNNPGLIIFPHATADLPYADGDNGNGEMRYIWMMSSHTHKYGTAYNLYVNDPSAHNGYSTDTLYNGDYEYDPSGATLFDRGYYDWEHPSVKYFVPQRPVDFSNGGGIVAQTTWNNTGGNLIHFGYTTADEMQLFYYMYTTRIATTAVNEVKSSDIKFAVYPNPMTDQGTLMYTLDNPATVKATIVNVAGSEVATLKEERNQAGTYTMDMGPKALAKGIYFARLSVDGATYTRKFVVQ
ncbi:MAG: T9SS type A sorting domain-containing protein [Bacteroidetes bacterium]|nr:T9SS type A sorting domain-containing protein [Bacteroidota bacterium]